MGKAETVNNFIRGKLICGHLIASSCLVRFDWPMNDILAWPAAFYTAGPGLIHVNTYNTVGIYSLC